MNGVRPANERASRSGWKKSGVKRNAMQRAAWPGYPISERCTPITKWLLVIPSLAASRLIIAFSSGRILNWTLM
jgi:hypothetical protein